MMMMNMGGSSGGSMGSMGSSASMGSMGGSSGSMGMMSDPSMMNMGSMGAPNSMGMGQMPMNAYGYTAQGMPGNMQMGYANSGFDFTSIIGVLFNFALNLLSLVLVLALIVGTIVFVKKYLLEGNMNLAGLFSTKSNGICSCCGQPVQSKATGQQQTETKKA